MRQIFNRLIPTSALALSLLLAPAPRAGAAVDARPASLSGTWTMSLIGDHVIPLGLALQQDGTTLTGTLTMMGKDIPIKGELVKGAITLTGSATMMMRDHGATGETPGATRSAPVGMKFTGTVQEDGTLAGELAAPLGPMKWTAERLKERAAVRPAPAAATTSAPPISGAWNVSVIADHVTPVGLAIQEADGKLKATLTIMGGDVPLTGDYVGGALTLAGEFTADATSRSGMRGPIRITGALKDDGTLAGEFTISHGAFPMTGERLRERAPKSPGTL